MICDYPLRQRRFITLFTLFKKISKYYTKYYLYYTKYSIFTYHEIISRIKPLVSSDLSCQIKKVCCYVAVLACRKQCCFLWEVLIKPLVVIEMQYSKMRKIINKIKNLECLSHKYSSVYSSVSYVIT